MSIFLVVLWHAAGALLPLDEELILLRMPLFFCTAGFFIRKTFSDEAASKAPAKLANFIWLFFIWSYILFITFKIPSNIVNNAPVLDGLRNPISWLLYPPETTWFIYALFLSITFTYLCRKVPLIILLPLAIAGYMWSASDGVFRDVPFFLRVLRLYPFFLIGLISFEFFNHVVGKYRKIGIPMFVLFLFSVNATYNSYLINIPVVTFLVGLFGVVSLSLVVKTLCNWRGDLFISKWGRNSLYIYVIHKIVIAYSIFVIDMAFNLNPENSLRIAFTVVLAFIASFISFWIGSFISSLPQTSWLLSIAPVLKLFQKRKIEPQP